MMNVSLPSSPTTAVPRRNPNEIPILPEGVDPTSPSPVEPPPTSSEPKVHVPSPRQTLSYIRGLLESNHLDPKNKLGQNFLIDLNMLDLVVRSAELTAEDSVLEVGTGTATLTHHLADRAGGVFTVEIDTRFYNLVQPGLAKRPNAVSFHGDILAGKNELNPDVLRGWAELTTKMGCSRRKLVANLPYAVATPVISNLLLLTDVPIDRMVVMVQWEIGERLRAAVGTKDYNALSVLVQSVADVETVRKVGPANFHPRPQVDSAIVKIVPNPAKRARVGNVKKFRDFLRDLYTLRRKNLRAALAGWPRGKTDKAGVDAKLKELGIDGNVRAETLGIDDHLRLSTAFG
ncbi:MAG: 16S rRNA (adenine(1518)-N(6)/adenine(1519)-N(6))-dimethyltransferase RsmA [Fimbriiglobus sp.]|jgi:16S rRNA (adenine1518-N6/adenine1519-N6)-dimethyltransferase|nr:16S rRNA (adenine(1518)-N(6)/adenine(1519)-N(6))-dimethyltransferase RsmA [Fimbriiglobus sp.]